MPRKLYVNLPVASLDASVAFFTTLGFTFDPRFTDESASAMIVNDDTGVMLLARSRFTDFTAKAIADTATHTEAIFAFSAESRADVDRIVNAALEAGGSKAQDPQDHGFMYGWSFLDLDGHHWEVLYMDESALPAES
jgi:uncharacterized protein